ncbi:type II secretion system F family protein [Fructilactobacillus sp. Tb1]|uniref:type II secretion system F family protein n=1 Tax=Fructilactobacillus sp. Tb1 TaxID=3422304 RepID=UPI003D26E05F
MKFKLNTNSDKLSLQQQTFIFSTIAELLQIGFSISQSLSFIKTVSKKNRKIISKVEQGLENGDSLPHAMKFFLNNSMYQQLVIADEHGKIETGMQEISEFIQLRLKQQTKIRDIAIYPLILFFGLMIMLVAIKLFILPETDALGNVAKSQNWITYLLFVMAGFLVVFGFYKIKAFINRKAIYKANFLSRIPILGTVFSSYYEYYLTSNLAIMLSNGLDMRKIVQIFAKFKENSLLYEIGINMDQSLNRGISIDKIFKRYHFVSNELVVFLSNGSTNEVLAQNLQALSKLCFQRLIKKSEKLISLIQPTAFVIIGITIVVTYLKMLMPLYQSMESIY